MTEENDLQGLVEDYRYYLTVKESIEKRVQELKDSLSYGDICELLSEAQQKIADYLGEKEGVHNLGVLTVEITSGRKTYNYEQTWKNNFGDTPVPDEFMKPDYMSAVRNAKIDAGKLVVSRLGKQSVEITVN